MTQVVGGTGVWGVVKYCIICSLTSNTPRLLGNHDDRSGVSERMNWAVPLMGKRNDCTLSQLWAAWWTVLPDFAKEVSTWTLHRLISWALLMLRCRRLANATPQQCQRPRNRLENQSILFISYQKIARSTRSHRVRLQHVVSLHIAT